MFTMKRILLIFAFLLPLNAAARTFAVGPWRAESHSDETTVTERGDTLEIITPKGLTLWYDQRLEGDYEITYRAFMVDKGGKYDRVSDLNCFWAANDPENPSDIHARGEWRKGIFPNYKTMTLFYVGYGGNYNSTTRFRRYLIGQPDQPDAEVRPVIGEYIDPEHLLKPNQWFYIRIAVKNGMTRFFVNDELLFSRELAAQEGDGHFGLRLLQNHVLISNFRIRHYGDVFEGFKNFAEAYKVTEDEAVEGSGVKPLAMDCIRRKGNREFPYPTEGHELVTNPPLFTWPMADYEYPEIFPAPASEKTLEEYLHYDFQLGRNPDFSDALTANDLALPFYNHHSALAPGKWYWRYRVQGREWSETYCVDVPVSTPLYESPAAAEALTMLPEAHPRVFARATLGARPTADQKALLRVLRKKAATAFSKAPADYKVKGQEIPASASDSERKQIMRFHLRYEFEAVCSSVEDLLTVYRVEENEEYMTKALALADYIASQDPVQMFLTADFTGAKAMSTLAMVYDLAYGRLSAQQKAAYENFISAVASRLLAHCLSENIGSAEGILYAHFFQHTFCDLFRTSIAMKGHIAEASTWFKMLYDIWLSRTPGGGFLADGVWPNGNIGYIHVNMESMVTNYLLFKDLFHVNIFAHPWYANCANALAYTMPVNSAGDGFGDDSERIVLENVLRADFAFILGQELDNRFALDYAYALSGQNPAKPYIFSKANFMEYRLQHKQHEVRAATSYEVPQSAVFPQTGIAVMNRDVLNTDNNVFISFRSSPFGVGSHGLAEQNSFNISYKGKPLFYPTGYKITTADKHYLLCNKHSRARNTITVDGKTQAYSHSAYGWIARYLDSKDITYVLGDASKAYVPFDKSAINWITVLKEAGAYTSENGFILSDEDNPRVKTFRRHLAFLRPNIVVVYDELEAEKDVTWTFQLNGRERANMSLDGSVLLADTDNCDAQASVFASSSLRTELIDTNYVKPFDWLNPQRGRPAKTFETHQYHARFENAEKCSKMRFLAVIEIDESNAMHFSRLKLNSKGEFRIGSYRIKAEMNSSRPAMLEIKNTATGAYLLYGNNGKKPLEKIRRYSHSTLMYAPETGWQESADRHPLMSNNN